MTMWAMGWDDTKRADTVAHAWPSREVYDKGEPALCGDAVEYSTVLKRGAKFVRCDECKKIQKYVRPTRRELELLRLLIAGRWVGDEAGSTNYTPGRVGRTEGVLSRMANKGWIDWSEGVDEITITDVGRALIHSPSPRPPETPSPSGSRAPRTDGRLR